MSAKVEDEGTLGAFPLLDVVTTRRTRSEGIFRRVDGDRAHRLFMVSQRHHRFARRQVP